MPRGTAGAPVHPRIPVAAHGVLVEVGGAVIMYTTVYNDVKFASKRHPSVLLVLQQQLRLLPLLL
jgi:hypothetical protein